MSIPYFNATVSDCNRRKYLRQLKEEGWNIIELIPHTGNNYTAFVASRKARRTDWPADVLIHCGHDLYDFAECLIGRRNVDGNDVFHGPQDYLVVSFYTKTPKTLGGN